MSELNLKGKALHVLDAGDRGDPRFMQLIMLLCQRLQCNGQQVINELNRIATANNH